MRRAIGLLAGLLAVLGAVAAAALRGLAKLPAPVTPSYSECWDCHCTPAMQGSEYCEDCFLGDV